MPENRPARDTTRSPFLAYAVPMLLFILLLGMGALLKQPGGPFWRSRPEFWIYPVQTLLCGGALFFFRRVYLFQPLRRPFFVIAIALVVLVLWIAPQQFLGFPARYDGFDPTLLAGSPALYFATLVLRLLRLILVVPMLEEIFWRGLLLRYLVAENFEAVPFGTFSWFSFTVVTLGFALSHAPADWPAALVAGVLYNLVAYRTRSLTSCIAAHSLTNFALGCWILSTRQWGFW